MKEIKEKANANKLYLSNLCMKMWGFLSSIAQCVSSVVFRLTVFAQILPESRECTQKIFVDCYILALNSLFKTESEDSF